MSVDTQTLEFQSALGRAIAIWSQGRNIPLSLAAQLMEDGFDVSRLERVYRKPR